MGAVTESKGVLLQLQVLTAAATAHNLLMTS
jgi:hypothetical protein